SIIVKNASCQGTDGGVLSKISGGVLPYKISWNGSSDITASEIKNAKPGTYQMKVIDAAGCTITVTGVVLQDRCGPIAKDDDFSVDQGKVLMGDVTPNDTDLAGDPLIVTKLTDPKNGQISIANDGKFMFTPEDGFSGTVDFLYQICNASGLCDTAKVVIGVNAFTVVNLTPVLSSVREG